MEKEFDKEALGGEYPERAKLPGQPGASFPVRPISSEMCGVYMGPAYMGPPAPAFREESPDPSPAPGPEGKQPSPMTLMEQAALMSSATMMVYGGPEFFNDISRGGQATRGMSIESFREYQKAQEEARQRAMQEAFEGEGWFCGMCGHKNYPGSKFCCECGSCRPADYVPGGVQDP